MRGLVVGVVAAFVMGACAGATAPPGAGRTIQIEMNDYSFTPEIISLRAGEKVTLSFKNVGKLEHEFMAGSEPVIGKGYAMDWLAGAQLSGTGDHGMAHGGEGVRVAPNGTAVVTMVVPEPGGVFEFGCFVIAHYESGMRGRLIVDAAAPIPGQTTGASRAPVQTSMPSHAPMGDDDGEGH